jgi:poly(hydroxyalkanoate) granule-associated protein
MAATRSKTEEVVVEEVVVEEDVVEEARHKRLMACGRKAMLATIGAISLAQEELDVFTDKLVERGEIAEQDGKRLMSEMLERRKKDAKKAEGELDKRTEDLLNRMNVPTKADIDALSAKITALSKKVDELKKQ